MNAMPFKLIKIPDSDEDLLEECEVYTFRSSGPGGQHVNKTDSAVRVVHHGSGITVTCRRERSQHLNKMQCIETLRARIEKLNERPVPRIPTHVSRSAKRKRIERKTRRGNTKLFRKKPDIGD